MIGKVSDLGDRRRKRKSRSPGEAAEMAVRRFMNKKYDNLDEPQNLASGKPNERGGMVKDRDEIDD